MNYLALPRLSAVSLITGGFSSFRDKSDYNSVRNFCLTRMV